jgi:malonate transporter and related proteins
MVRQFATSPPLYAIAAGLVVSVFDLSVPAAIADPLATIGTATGVLMAIGVGIRFEAPGPGGRQSAKPDGWVRNSGLGKATAVYAVRLVSALAVAVAFILIFGLTGPDRTVLLLLAVAPTAFLIVAFATVENLDVRLAVNALSASMIISLPLALAVVFLTT